MMKAKIHSIVLVSLGVSLLAVTFGCQQMAGAPGSAPHAVLSSGGSDAANVAPDNSGGSTVADSGQGGTIGASVGTEQIGECPDPTKPCDQKTKPKTVSEQCHPQDYFRKVCWSDDFRKTLGLDQKTETEQFDAIRHGELPEETLKLASFVDICVDQVDVAKLASYPKDWENLCLFVKPASDSIFIYGNSYSTTEDYRNAFTGSGFLAFASHEGGGLSGGEALAGAKEHGYGLSPTGSNGSSGSTGSSGPPAKIPRPSK